MDARIAELSTQCKENEDQVKRLDAGLCSGVLFVVLSLYLEITGT
jgi:hypothetical protein